MSLWFLKILLDVLEKESIMSERTPEGSIHTDSYIKNKKLMSFPSVESLQQVVNVLNECAAALNDKTRTIRESSISEVLGGVVGAGFGGAVSFTALYGLGIVGFSAAGITSGLAAAGAIVGGGMVAGVFVLAAPVAIGAGTCVAVVSRIKNKQLLQEKERIYVIALEKSNEILNAMESETEASEERKEYLKSLHILLDHAIEDLGKDLGLD